MVSSLTQAYLGGVISHPGLRLCDENGIALTDQSKVRGLVSSGNVRSAASTDRRNILCLRRRELIAVTIIGQVVPSLTVVAQAKRELIGQSVFANQRELVNVCRLCILRPHG